MKFNPKKNILKTHFTRTNLEVPTWSSLIILSILSLFSPNSSQAIKQYHCNGMIQYKPCIEDSIDTDRLGSANSYRNFSRELEVSNLSYKKLPDSQGEWRGVIHGESKAIIWLYLFNSDLAKIDNRLIGIKNIRSKLSFNFRTKLPENVKNWSWEVKAFGE